MIKESGATNTDEEVKLCRIDDDGRVADRITNVFHKMGRKIPRNTQKCIDEIKAAFRTVEKMGDLAGQTKSEKEQARQKREKESHQRLQSFLNDSSIDRAKMVKTLDNTDKIEYNDTRKERVGNGQNADVTGRLSSREGVDRGVPEDRQQGRLYDRGSETERRIGRGDQGVPANLLSEHLSDAYKKSGKNAVELYDYSGDPAAFSNALDEARNADKNHGWAVTPQSETDLNGKRLFMDENATIGAAVTKEGDIEGVFKNKKLNNTHHALDGVMPQLIEAGGRKLDCYGEILVRNYEDYGFIPVARVEFNPEYANPGWDESKGRPYIYFMMHNGDSAAEVVANIGQYEHMSLDRLKSLPEFDYDGALDYRDSLLEKQKAGERRYSSRDAAYMPLAEKYRDGTATEEEKAELEKMVEEAARKAGYTIKAYHGTDADFTVFDLDKIGKNFHDSYGGFYFRSKNNVGYYGNKTVAAYLKMTNPMVLNAPDGFFNAEDYYDISPIDRYETAKANGNDGIIVHHKKGDMYLVFEPSQIKSAEPVTYDEKGDIIPLSERFHTDRTGEDAWKNEDVRYSKKENDTTLNDIRTIQAIGKKSINDFSSADIQKAEKWARKFWKDIGPKSPFFRAWFGDWRAYDNTPVAVATNLGAVRGHVKNVDTGWDINVSGQVFNETKVHQAKANKAALPYLQYINDIVKNAVLLDTFVSKNGGQSLFMHSLYAVADIGNGRELLKLYVEELNDPNSTTDINRAYELRNIENWQSGVTGSRNNSNSPIAQATNIGTIAQLFEAVKQRDSSFIPKPVDPHLLNEDGTPKFLYHQTDSKEPFYVFEVGRQGAGYYDNEMPSGIFMKETPERLKLGLNYDRSRQVPLYAAISNPLIFYTREDALEFWKKNVPGYRELKEQADEIDRKYRAEEKRISDELYLSEADENGVDPWEAAMDDLFDNHWIPEENAVSRRMKEAVDKWLADSEYDGLILENDKGTGETVKTYVALKNTQVKSATDNIGTFDRENDDTLFSSRADSDIALWNPPDVDTRGIYEAVKNGSGTVEDRFDVTVKRSDRSFTVNITDNETGKTYTDRGEVYPGENVTAKAERYTAAILKIYPCFYCLSIDLIVKYRSKRTHLFI